MRVGTAGFVGARLTEARQARGLTQTGLSQLTGIRGQSISHYEQGRQSPSPEALEVICEKLDLPERYFLRLVSDLSNGKTRFRSSNSRARLARLQAASRLNWVVEITQYLAQYVDLPAPQIPTLRVPSGTAAADAAIEQAAAMCRQQFDVGSGPVTDMLVLLENAGCTVSQFILDRVLGGSCSCWARGTPYIVLQPRTGVGRLQLDAAHELGHLVLHRDVEREGTQDPELHRILELEADRFARAFLLPERTFGKEVWAATIDALLSLKRQWRCPVEAMIYRCGEIGRFSQDEVRRALINLTRRGWKTGGEPFEDPPPTPPRLLARSMMLLLDEGVRDRHSILTDLGLAAADIEELAGLPAGFFAGHVPQLPQALRLRSESIP